MTNMDTFSNREIATGIWISAALAWILWMPTTRRALSGVVRAFFQRQILLATSAMLAWIALVVYGLSEAGLWNVGQLKNTILWTVSVAAVSLFRLPTIADDTQFFARTAKDIFKLIVILEFIVTSYTFGFIAELIIVPAAALVGGMLAVAEQDPKYDLVRKFLNGLVGAFGIALIANAVLALMDDVAAFATRETLDDFMVPIVLGLLLLPFLFVMTVFLNYKLAFTRLRILVSDEDLRSYARRKAIMHFRLDSVLARRWAHDLATLDRQSREEIDASIDHLLAMRATEKKLVLEQRNDQLGQSTPML